MQITGNEFTVSVKETEGKWEIIGRRKVNEECFFLLQRADQENTGECIIVNEQGFPVMVDLDLKSTGEFDDALNAYFMTKGDGPPLSGRKGPEYQPVYAHDSFYAVEHGEENLFRQSKELNFACKRGIEHSIDDHFDGMFLDAGVVTPVLEAFGPERVAYVLSTTIEANLWDGRFSRENKQWAREQEQAFYEGEEKSCADCVVNSHPALLNGFIDLFRKEAKVPDHMSLADFEKEIKQGEEKEKTLFQGPNGWYGIYQIREDSPGKAYEFLYMDYIKKEGLKVKGEDYDLIYVDMMTPGNGLDDIFRKFNVEIPEDFKGHSLSVSDVIAVKDENQLMAFYVDRIGYYRLNNFIPERMAMLDPVIDRDKDQDKEKKLRTEPEPEKKERARVR